MQRPTHSNDTTSRGSRPNVLTPPGWRFRRALEITCSRKLGAQILAPLHAELATEWTEAHVDGSAWRIAMVAVRYYAGLGLLFLRSPFAALLRLLRR